MLGSPGKLGGERQSFGAAQWRPCPRRVFVPLLIIVGGAADRLLETLVRTPRIARDRTDLWEHTGIRIHSFQAGPVSYVTTLFKLSFVMTVIWGALFLKEILFRVYWSIFNTDGSRKVLLGSASDHSSHSKNMSDCVYLCPCGWYGDSIKPCTCAPSAVTKYQKRISGPLLDRIDIHVEVPRVDYEKLSNDRLGESSAIIRRRVEAARQIQRERFVELIRSDSGKGNSITCNADMRIAEVRKYCKLDETSESLMRSAMSQMNLSARAYHRVLKLARTITDLAGSESIQPPHLAEALQYRPKILVS